MNIEQTNQLLKERLNGDTTYGTNLLPEEQETHIWTDNEGITIECCWPTGIRKLLSDKRFTETKRIHAKTGNNTIHRIRGTWQQGTTFPMNQFIPNKNTRN